MSDNLNENEQKQNEPSQDKMIIPVSEDDMPRGSESFLSGFFTGALAAISVFLFVILVVLIVAGKRIGFVNVSNKYDNTGKIDNIEEDMDLIEKKILPIRSGRDEPRDKKPRREVYSTYRIA